MIFQKICTVYQGNLSAVTFTRGYEIGDINGDKIDDLSWISHEGVLYCVFGDGEVDPTHLPQCTSSNVDEYHESGVYCTALKQAFTDPTASNGVSIEEGVSATHTNYCLWKGYEEAGVKSRVLTGGGDKASVLDFSRNGRYWKK